MSVQPIGSFTDSSGESWLRLSNGHKIRLPGGGTGPYVLKAGDTMTGPLTIDMNAPTSPDPVTSEPMLELRRPAHPTLRIVKEGAPVDKRVWAVYASGPPGRDDPTDHALTFLADSDDGAADLAVLRMLRDGRLILGADPVGALDAVTKQHLREDAADCSPAAGWSHVGGTYGNVKVTRFGPLVCLQGMFSAAASTAIAVWTTVGSVPPGWAPTNATQGAGTWNGVNPIGTYVSTGGVIQVRAANANTTVPAAGTVAINLTWRA